VRPAEETFIRSEAESFGSASRRALLNQAETIFTGARRQKWFPRNQSRARSGTSFIVHELTRSS
jgi:hypothetical protein